MTNSFDAESTVFFAMGEPTSFDVTDTFTDEDWAEHDAYVAAEIARQDALDDDQYWSGTGELMSDDSYIDYLNR